jgi:hypothetical protein
MSALLPFFCKSKRFQDTETKWRECASIIAPCLHFQTCLCVCDISDEVCGVENILVYVQEVHGSHPDHIQLS